MANAKPRVTTTTKFRSALQQPIARSVQSKPKSQTAPAVGQSLSKSSKQKKLKPLKKPTQTTRRSTLMSNALMPIMRSRTRTVRAVKSKSKIRTDKVKSKSKNLSNKSATKKPKSTTMARASNKGKVVKSKSKGDDTLKSRAIGGADVAFGQMKSPKKVSQVKRNSLVAKEIFIDKRVADLRRKRNRLAAGIEQLTAINTSNNPYTINASKNILANGNYNYDYNNYSNYSNYNNYNYNGNSTRSAPAPTGTAAATAAGVNATDLKTSIDLEVPLTTRLPIIDFISTDEFARMAECRNLRSKY